MSIINISDDVTYDILSDLPCCVHKISIIIVGLEGCNECERMISTMHNYLDGKFEYPIYYIKLSLNSNNISLFENIAGDSGFPLTLLLSHDSLKKKWVGFFNKNDPEIELKLFFETINSGIIQIQSLIY